MFGDNQFLEQCFLFGMFIAFVSPFIAVFYICIHLRKEWAIKLAIFLHVLDRGKLD